MQRPITINDHGTFRESVREFVRNVLAPTYEQILADTSVPRAVWKEAGAHGLLGVQVPVEYGGAGMSDFRFNAIVAEEVSQHSHSVASFLSVHSDVCAFHIAQLGTEGQKRRWLPDIAAGEKIWSMVAAQPTHGSRTSARRISAVRDGEDWVLDGVDSCVVNGVHADLFVVAASVGPAVGSEGITLFVVDSGMRGFSRRSKAAPHEFGTADVFFDQVRLPDTNRLGPVSKGFAAMTDSSPRQRLAAAVADIGHAARILHDTTEHVGQRFTTGRSFGWSPVGKPMLSDMATSLNMVTAFLDYCMTAYARGELSDADAAKVRRLSNDIRSQVMDRCLPSGRRGRTPTCCAGERRRGAGAVNAWLGTNDIRKELIGRASGL
ncbi:acyl-CoA dehydrogenase family protein [Nocardia sp. CNY236]|uniref:acyl-CoA dehydrogenase family protein n=1 Tax=Nocardia sp. CNY236 TaxID=1169152 RepID=UPI00042720D9|nr:acyl-CoA dehydrogenase family protein [Nocardia sp. CNY236]